MKNIKFGKIDNFVLFGGGQIIAEICNFLKKNKKNILVLTSKDQAAEIIYPNKTTLKRYLVDNKIKYKILKNLKDKSKWSPFIKENTIAISNRCRWIFKLNDLKFFKNNLLNYHGTSLPSFRGGGGNSWNIMMNNFISGATIHLIDNRIDLGKSVLNKKFSFPKKIRSSLANMHLFSMQFQKKVIIEFLKDLLKNKMFIVKEIINDKSSSYWPRIKSEKHGWINWSWNADDIVNFIHSFSDPYPGAATFINNKIIRFKLAKLANSKLKFHPFQFGLIYRKTYKEIYVATKMGGVILDISKLKNTKNLLGKRLITKSIILDKALESTF